MNSIFIIAIALLSLASAALIYLILGQKREMESLKRVKADDNAKIAALGSEVAHITFERNADRVRITQERSDDVCRMSKEISDKEVEIRALIGAKVSAHARLEAVESQFMTLKEEQKNVEESFRAQFKNLATDILNEQTKQFKETNRESMDTLLKPFRDNISEFRERVEKIYTDGNQQQGALRNELKTLTELNHRITTETTNLTQALKGNSKTQGDWGEMILETILDNSKLIKGIHYDTQVSIKDSEGKVLRPDVVLFLPEKKRIVIDSKVSLTAFVDYTAAECEVERTKSLARHIASVRQHVTGLGRKEYQRLLDSPDFVIMFIANEPAFLAALQNDGEIWTDAYDKKVIISSPTNLFALLKLVDDLWRRNEQNKNSADIVSYGTKLYEQLVAFTASLESVGQSLDIAKEKYNDAYKRLHTGNDNIIRSGERLRKLGIPTKKSQSIKILENCDHLNEV